MIERLTSPFRSIHHHMQVAGGWEISRRYAVMNGFDGILTVLGVTLSAYLLGIENPAFVLGTGISASIAIGVSGFWIAFLTEEAEQSRNKIHLEQILFTDLDNSIVHKSARIASFVNSFIDGFSPFFFGSLSLLPFLFALSGNFSISLSFHISFAISAILLFVLGIFLGMISKRNIVITGIKTIFAGIIVTVLILLTGL